MHNHRRGAAARLPATLKRAPHLHLPLVFTACLSLLSSLQLLCLLYLAPHHPHIHPLPPPTYTLWFVSYSPPLSFSHLPHLFHAFVSPSVLQQLSAIPLTAVFLHPSVASVSEVAAGHSEVEENNKSWLKEYKNRLLIRLWQLDKLYFLPCEFQKTKVIFCF